MSAVWHTDVSKSALQSQLPSLASLLAYSPSLSVCLSLSCPHSEGSFTLSPPSSPNKPLILALLHVTCLLRDIPWQVLPKCAWFSFLKDPSVFGFQGYVFVCFSGCSSPESMAVYSQSIVQSLLFYVSYLINIPRSSDSFRPAPPSRWDKGHDQRCGLYASEMHLTAPQEGNGARMVAGKPKIHHRPIQHK